MRIRSIYENSADGIMLTVPKTRDIIDANPAALAMLGMTKKELQSLHAVHDRSIVVDEKALAGFIEKRSQAGKWRGELTFRRKDGTLFTADVSSSVFTAGDRQMASVVFRDITERKAMEAELRASRDELEQKVQERTEELQAAYDRLMRESTERLRAEEQLRHAQKIEALGTMAGGVAHDFNNILAAIIGFTELTKDGLPKGTHNHLDQVLKAALRGRDLVQQMLMFSRKGSSERTPLKLSSVITETMQLIRASIPTTVEIKVEIESESGVVMGDGTQLQQVFINVCNNAADAMRDKGGVLTIRLTDYTLDAPGHLGLAPGSYVRVSVSDTGEGMTPETLRRVFEPFFTTKQRGQGTGLGLSVVHGIITSYDGEITAESAPGKGTTFTIYLPAEAETRRSHEEENASVPKGDERVLFVDDEETVLDVGRRIMQSIGYNVTARASSREALELFRKDPEAFDLIITDQSMPEITGLQLSRQAKAVRRNVPIILSTGFSHLVNADSARAAGIDALVMKPLTKCELARTVRQVLDERG